jgi:hypothetical protein
MLEKVDSQKSHMQHRAFGPGPPTESSDSITQGPELEPLYIAHGGRGGRSLGLRLLTKGQAVLTSMRVQAVSTAHDAPLAPLCVVERLFIGYRDVHSSFEDTLIIEWV